MDEFFTLLSIGGEEAVASPPVKGARVTLDPRASTYLDPLGMRKSSATGDIPQAEIAEIVEVVRGKDEDAVFRRSNIMMRSPPGGRLERAGSLPEPPGIGGLLEGGNLLPVVQLEKMETSFAVQTRARRASTPLDATGSEVNPTICVDESTLIQEGGDQQGFLISLRPLQGAQKK